MSKVKAKLKIFFPNPRLIPVILFWCVFLPLGAFAQPLSRFIAKLVKMGVERFQGG